MFKKFITLFLGACVAFASTASFAADARLTVSQEGTQTVVLSGNLGVANANKVVVAQVFAQGYSYDNLEMPVGANISDKLRFSDDGMTNDKGEYEFKFDITSGSQWITPYISTDSLWLGGADYDYMFINDGEWREIAGIINDAANSPSTTDDSNVLTQITNKHLVLGYSVSDVSSIDKGKLANIVLNMTKTENLNIDNRDDAWNALKRALMVEKLNESKITNIYSVDDAVTDFSSSKIKDWYNSEYVIESLETNFTERLSGKNFTSIADYEAALEEAFILATVRYPNGIDNVEAIVKAFDDKIGVNTTSVKESVWSALGGNDYATLSALKTAFNSLNGTGGNGGGTGGGAAGGGGTADSGSNINHTGPINGAQTTLLNKNIFDDLAGCEWASEAIAYLAEKQIINGTGNGKFEPDAQISREQFCKIVIGAFMPDAENVEVPFGDVNKNEWYADYVAKAYGCGIVKGTDDKNFGIGQPITRQDMCVMIYRAAVASGMEIKAEAFIQFADDEKIADYAKEAVYSLKEFGAVNGISETEFSPFGNATRAQAAKIIYHLIKQ